MYDRKYEKKTQKTGFKSVTKNLVLPNFIILIFVVVPILKDKSPDCHNKRHWLIMQRRVSKFSTKNRDRI